MFFLRYVHSSGSRDCSRARRRNKSKFHTAHNIITLLAIAGDRFFFLFSFSPVFTDIFCLQRQTVRPRVPERRRRRRRRWRRRIDGDRPETSVHRRIVRNPTAQRAALGRPSNCNAQTTFGRVLRVHGTPTRTGNRK